MNALSPFASSNLFPRQIGTLNCPVDQYECANSFEETSRCISFEFECCPNGEGCNQNSHYCYMGDRCCPIDEICEDAEKHLTEWGSSVDIDEDSDAGNG